MSDENVPMDAVAFNAEAVVHAALQWKIRQGFDPVLNTDEWRLFNACEAYGDKYRGVRAK